MKGIPAELHHETLNKTLQKMPSPPNLIFTEIFGTQQYESDRIRWQLEYGTAGLTPFTAPGSPAPVMGDDAFYNEGAAAAAYWKEKIFLDEVRLNNLRDPLTPQARQTAQMQLARQERRLKNRCMRRREWMMAKAFFDNSITYAREKGTKFTVTYGVPSNNQITLTGQNVWWNDSTSAPGTSATPIRDIFDLKKQFAEDVGVQLTDCFMNSTVLNYLMFNADLQTLLQKSAFGDGDLFSQPARVLGSILGLPNLTVYDDLFEVSAWVAADLAVGQTVMTVDDSTDFEVGQTCRLYNMLTPYDYEDLTISAVSIPNNTITFSAVTTVAYKAGRDRAVMRKKFIPDDKVGFFARAVDGEKIAEFMEAPFGLGRHFGMFADTKEEWDPDGIWLRCQSKGLPVIYYPNALMTLTVK